MADGEPALPPLLAPTDRGPGAGMLSGANKLLGPTPCTGGHGEEGFALHQRLLQDRRKASRRHTNPQHLAHLFVGGYALAAAPSSAVSPVLATSARGPAPVARRLPELGQSGVDVGSKTITAQSRESRVHARGLCPITKHCNASSGKQDTLTGPVGMSGLGCAAPAACRSSRAGLFCNIMGSVRGWHRHCDHGNQCMPPTPPSVPSNGTHICEGGPENLLHVLSCPICDSSHHCIGLRVGDHGIGKWLGLACLRGRVTRLACRREEADQQLPGVPVPPVRGFDETYIRVIPARGALKQSERTFEATNAKRTHSLLSTCR